MGVQPNLYKITLNSVDITTHTYRLQYKRYRNQPVKTGTIKIHSNVINDITLSDEIIGKELTIQRGFDSPTERYILRGEITSFKNLNSTYELNFSCKMYRANKRTFDYTFEYNIDPSAGVGSEIFKALCDIIGLSYTNESIPTTGTDDQFIIKQIRFQDSILSSMKELGNIYQRIIYYNDEDDLVYFVPDNSIPTTTVLTTGIEIANRIQWNTTGEDLANNITIIGGTQLDWNTQSFIGDGITKDFKLDTIPIDTDVYINSTKVYRGVDSSDLKDFIVHNDTKIVSFTTAPALGDIIDINYSYNIPVKVQSSDNTSINKYTQHDLTIVDTRMTNTDDTELQVNNILEQKAQALTSTPLKVLKNNDLVPGQSILIIDKTNNINKTVNVIGIDYAYPYPGDLVEVGQVASSGLDIQINIIDSIQKLQRQLASNSDINLQIINNPQDLKIMGYTQVLHATIDLGVLYWDSDTQGTWDDFNWGDDNEETYEELSITYINDEVI